MGRRLADERVQAEPEPTRIRFWGGALIQEPRVQYQTELKIKLLPKSNEPYHSFVWLSLNKNSVCIHIHIYIYVYADVYIFEHVCTCIIYIYTRIQRTHSSSSNPCCSPYRSSPSSLV